MEANEKLLKKYILTEITAWKREIQGEALPIYRLMKWKNTPNTFFHLTNGIDKIEFDTKAKSEATKTHVQLSLNINSKYGSPVGVYGYPMFLIVDHLNKKIKFAADRNYIIVFKPKNINKIIKVSSYSENDFELDVEKLRNIFGGDEEKFDQALNSAKIDTYKQTGESAAGMLWTLTWYLRKNQRDWTKIFRNLGYQGFYDDIGYSIVHVRQPYQGVFFSEAFINTLDVMKNPNIKNVSRV